MVSQKDEKSVILSRVSLFTTSLWARDSAEEVELLDTEVTCFKQDFCTPGKMDGGWLGLFPRPPLAETHSQSK